MTVKILIKYDTKDVVELTVEEAKELRDELNKLFPFPTIAPPSPFEPSRWTSTAVGSWSEDAKSNKLF